MADAPKKQASTASEEDIHENKLWAAIGYLGILFLIPLLGKKDSPYAQYHGKQGFVLFIAWVVLGFISWIPILGWIVGLLGTIGLFIIWLFGIMNVLGGRMEPLPLIGQYADQLKF